MKHMHIQDDSLSRITIERSKSPCSRLNFNLMPCARNSKVPTSFTSIQISPNRKPNQDRIVESKVREAYHQICLKQGKHPNQRLLTNLKCSEGLISFEKACVNDTMMQAILSAIKSC